ncbi:MULTISPECIES: alpha/beta fold hydrolase [unclassified Pannonibacter]|uniref:alpha/beta hydrolase family protein n=1 Tax=unclassified Pannonibacter TaxID=2627228 RepID=UPI001FCAFCEE|nr:MULTISPECIES: alpha/beta fold hydrolase [unclassified Pannonibacter]
MHNCQAQHQEITRPAPAAKEGARIRLRAPDGVPLGGLVWRHPAPDPRRPVAVIAPATSVRCSYYGRFAGYLHEHGFEVLTLDYRGIGFSRPANLRGFQADWADWGDLDVEAGLRLVEQQWPGQPLHLIGHSIGGLAIGLAPSARNAARLLTVGAQHAYWRDYDPQQRRRMYLKWHVFMPLVTRLFGYFPGKRLDWLEDTPAGVVRDWSRMGPQLAEHLRQDMFIGGEREGEILTRRLARITAPLLAIGLDDDPFGTPQALERLLACYSASPRQHLRLGPQHSGGEPIGHFNFFHTRFRPTLWPIALRWLQEGEIVADGRTNG